MAWETPDFSEPARPEAIEPTVWDNIDGIPPEDEPIFFTDWSTETPICGAQPHRTMLLTGILP